MVAVCQQPNYFPWLGYLEQCARAQVFVSLDSVQWIRQGRQHRTRVLSTDAASPFQWLTIPVLGTSHRTKSIRELEIDPDSKWALRHWKTLSSVYGRSPYFKSQLEPLVRAWFEKQQAQKFFCDVAFSSIELCMQALDIKPSIVRSSELPETGTKTERLISLCQLTGSETYYSALGSTRYVDVAAFRAAGIRLLWQHWKHPDYDQGRERFQSHLSILDVFANVPLEKIKEWMQPNPYGPFKDLVQTRSPDHSL